jgi:hypothetical protein
MCHCESVPAPPVILSCFNECQSSTPMHMPRPILQEMCTCLVWHISVAVQVTKSVLGLESHKSHSLASLPAHSFILPECCFQACTSESTKLKESMEQVVKHGHLNLVTRQTEERANQKCSDRQSSVSTTMMNVVVGPEELISYRCHTALQVSNLMVHHLPPSDVCHVLSVIYTAFSNQGE